MNEVVPVYTRQQESKALVVDKAFHAVTAAAYHVLQDAVTRFAEYVDPTGKKATSPKGFVITMNRRVEQAFGPMDTLTRRGECLLQALRYSVDEIIEHGMREQHTREAIKRRVYAAFDQHGACYIEFTR